jgi:hypothetical protein
MSRSGGIGKKLLLVGDGFDRRRNADLTLAGED